MLLFLRFLKKTFFNQHNLKFIAWTRKYLPLQLLPNSTCTVT